MSNYRFTVEEFHEFVDPDTQTASWFVPIDSVVELVQGGADALNELCADDAVEDGHLLEEIDYSLEDRPDAIGLRCEADATEWLKEHPAPPKKILLVAGKPATIYRMVVPVAIEDDESDLMFVKVACTNEDRLNAGIDQVIAEIWAKSQGYNELLPPINCDIHPMGRAIVNAFLWDTASLLTMEDVVKIRPELLDVQTWAEENGIAIKGGADAKG